MFRCYSYTIIRERINFSLLKLQLLKQSTKTRRCAANTHSLTQSIAEQCNTQTPIRTQYMQPHLHRTDRTPVYFNGLF